MQERSRGSKRFDMGDVPTRASIYQEDHTPAHWPPPTDANARRAGVQRKARSPRNGLIASQLGLPLQKSAPAQSQHYPPDSWQTQAAADGDWPLDAYDYAAGGGEPAEYYDEDAELQAALDLDNSQGLYEEYYAAASPPIDLHLPPVAAQHAQHDYQAYAQAYAEPWNQEDLVTSHYRRPGQSATQAAPSGKYPFAQVARQGPQPSAAKWQTQQPIQRAATPNAGRAARTQAQAANPYAPSQAANAPAANARAKRPSPGQSKAIPATNAPRQLARPTTPQTRNAPAQLNRNANTQARNASAQLNHNANTQSRNAPAQLNRTANARARNVPTQLNHTANAQLSRTSNANTEARSAPTQSNRAANVHARNVPTQLNHTANAQLSGNANAQAYGANAQLNRNANAQAYGANAQLNHTANAQLSGNANAQAYGANAQAYGANAQLNRTANAQAYGANAQLSGNANAQAYGANAQLSGNANAQAYGANAQLNRNANAQAYGANAQLNRTANAQAYGANAQAYGANAQLGRSAGWQGNRTGTAPLNRAAAPRLAARSFIEDEPIAYPKPRSSGWLKTFVFVLCIAAGAYVARDQIAPTFLTTPAPRPLATPPVAPAAPPAPVIAEPPAPAPAPEAAPAPAPELSPQEEAKARRSAARAAIIAERWRERRAARRAQGDLDDDSSDRPDTTASEAPAPSTHYAPKPAPQPGILRINSRPWSNIFVDGQPVGHTPQMNLQLPAGQHQITLINNEMQLRKAVNVTITPGETTTQTVNLAE